MTQTNKIKDYLNYYVDMICLKHNSYDRIIVDKEPQFPDNYKMIGHNTKLELSTKRWNEHRGWGKPDLVYGGVEVHKIWKDISIKTFSEWAR